MTDKFKYSTNENTDEIKIEFFVKNSSVGHLIFEIFDDNKAEEFFSDYCTIEEYEKIIPENKFIYLGYLYIVNKHRNKGYGNILMKKFIEFVNNKYNGFKFEKIVLYANPYDFSVPLEILKKFYNKYGFEEVNFETFYEKNTETYLELNFNNNIMIKKL